MLCNSHQATYSCEKIKPSDLAFFPPHPALLKRALVSLKIINGFSRSAASMLRDVCSQTEAFRDALQLCTK